MYLDDPEAAHPFDITVKPCLAHDDFTSAHDSSAVSTQVSNVDNLHYAERFLENDAIEDWNLFPASVPLIDEDNLSKVVDGKLIVLGGQLFMLTMTLRPESNFGLSQFKENTQSLRAIQAGHY